MTPSEDFCGFVGLATADEFQIVTRSHVLVWRAQLEKRGPVLLYHGLRREEAVQLLVSHIQERRGSKHLQVHGRDGKVRYRPCTQ
jgi:integrase